MRRMESGVAAVQRSHSVADKTGNDVGEMAECINMLRDKLQRAQAELGKLNERLSAKKGYRLGSGDPTIYEWEMDLARKKKVEGRIESIEEAVERALRGNYGPCERCGCMIQVDRLALLPFTSLCIGCARAGE